MNSEFCFRNGKKTRKKKKSEVFHQVMSSRRYLYVYEKRSETGADYHLL